MISQPVIVGCGTVGSALAFGLAKSNLISDLKICDFDTVSEFSDGECYPFLSCEAGISKVDVIKFYCRYLNPSMEVKAYQQKITTNIFQRSFVIDCRDSKQKNINAKVRISLDGHMLYVDSMSYDKSECDYHRYITARNKKFINKAIDIVIDYLIKDFYIYRDFRFYDLRNGNVHILKRENFYGSIGPRNNESGTNQK